MTDTPDSLPVPDRRTCARLARNLRASLAERHALSLKHTQALDLLAGTFGRRNRHELAEHQAADQQVTNPAAATRPLPHALDTDDFDDLQRLVVSLYDDGEFAGMASPREAVGAGDTLLTFLLIELSRKEDCDSFVEARDRVGSAMRQLEQLHDALDAAADNAQAPTTPDSSDEPIDLSSVGISAALEAARAKGADALYLEFDAAGHDETPGCRAYPMRDNQVWVQDPVCVPDDPERLRYIAIGLHTAYPATWIPIRAEGVRSQRLSMHLVYHAERTAGVDTRITIRF